MGNDKIKEAIRVQQKEYDIHYKGKTSEHATEGFLRVGRTLKTLIDLAKAYRDAGEGLPEKKDHLNFLSNVDGKLVDGRTLKDWVKFGYNQAIDDCQLALTKKLMSGGLVEVAKLEGLHNLLDYEIYRKRQQIGIQLNDSEIGKIAAAIRNYLTGNKGE